MRTIVRLAVTVIVALVVTVAVRSVLLHLQHRAGPHRPRARDAMGEEGRLRSQLADEVARHRATTDQLERARTLLRDMTAISNENMRLRGAVDALTDALARRDDRSDDVSDNLVEELRSELLSLEAQVKELSEERDRAVEEVDELRQSLDSRSNDDTVRRLMMELDHVRRSLDVERRRNLRLGARRDERLA